MMGVGPYVCVTIPSSGWRMRLGIADNGQGTPAITAGRIEFRFGWQARRNATHGLYYFIMFVFLLFQPTDT